MVPLVAVPKLRGTISAHLWPGVTVGASQSSAVRQATLTGLQAAIDYACANSKFFEIEPGIYEIEGAAGLVVPYGKRTLSWHGSKGSHIRQATNGAPCITFGDVTTSNTLEDATVRGFRASHISTQVGQSAGSAVRMGLVRNSLFDDWEAGADFDGSGPVTPSYKGLQIVNAANSTGFFSNTLSNFKVAGAAYQLLDWSLVGTGSRLVNGYFTGGITGTPYAFTAAAPISIAGTADLYETVLDTVNFEHIRVTDYPLAVLQSCRGMSFIGCHMEGNDIRGYDPRLFQVSTSQLNFLSGNQIQDLYVPSVASGTTSGLTPVLFGTYGDCDIKGAGLFILSWSAASKVLQSTQIVCRNRYAAATDKANCMLNYRVRDVGANNEAFLDFTGVGCEPITDEVKAQTNDFTYSVPAGWQIDAIYIKNNTANAVTGGIKIGTSSGGTQVVTAQAVGANANLRINALTINWFSATSAQTLYIQDVTAWNSANLDFHIVRSKHW